MAYGNTRRFFRVHYPLRDRPVLQGGGEGAETGAFTVLDVSEEGVRFRAADTAVFQVGDSFQGVIELAAGWIARIEGTVVRVDRLNGEVALTLTEGIPYAHIVEEQRFLHAKYQFWS